MLHPLFGRCSRRCSSRRRRPSLTGRRRPESRKLIFRYGRARTPLGPEALDMRVRLRPKQVRPGIRLLTAGFSRPGPRLREQAMSKPDLLTRLIRHRIIAREPVPLGRGAGHRTAARRRRPALDRGADGHAGRRSANSDHESSQPRRNQYPLSSTDEQRRPAVSVACCLDRTTLTGGFTQVVGPCITERTRPDQNGVAAPSSPGRRACAVLLSRSGYTRRRRGQPVPGRADRAR